jgi:hypothetical protein
MVEHEHKHDNELDGAAVADHPQPLTLQHR